MTEINREELFYAVERWLIERDGFVPVAGDETAPYIQEGDVEDVVTALEALGYKLVKAG